MTDRGSENASLIRRLLAILYDSLLALALVFVLSVPVVALNAGDAIPAGTGWYRAYVVIIGSSYFLFFWLRGGQTLGMKSWRIRLVAAEGGPVSFRQALIRLAGALISWLPAGAGFAWSLIDRDRLAWHDRLSGTRLVRWEPQRSANA